MSSTSSNDKLQKDTKYYRKASGKLAVLAIIKIKDLWFVHVSDQASGVWGGCSNNMQHAQHHFVTAVLYMQEHQSTAVSENSSQWLSLITSVKWMHLCPYTSHMFHSDCFCESDAPVLMVHNHNNKCLALNSHLTCICDCGLTFNNKRPFDLYSAEWFQDGILKLRFLSFQ